MHAYLLVNGNDQKLNEKLDFLSEKLHARIIEFPLSKIEDVRILRKDLRISMSENVVFLIKNIDSATKEAQNALLKSLEEPPKNVFFFLSAKRRDAVTPTILSRCQIFSFRNDIGEVRNDVADNFLKAKTGIKLRIIDQIKKREEALEFVENLIKVLHNNLLSEKKNFRKLGLFMTESQNTLNALKANGNVTIQMVNLVVKLDRTDLSDTMDEV